MSLSRAPVRLTTPDGILHASSLSDPQGSTWCGLVNASLTAVHFNQGPPPPPHETVCPDCERIHRERYPDPATFNVHQPDADGVVSAVNLQDFTAQSPSDFSPGPPA